MQPKRFHRAVTALTTLAVSGLASADWTERSAENLRPGVTDSSETIYDLHMAILWVCVAIFALVFGLIMWSMINHRRSKRPKPATFHEHLGLEVVWTIIPFVILIFMAWPATVVLIDLEDTSDSVLTVKVTGHQWYWSYEYLSYEDDPDLGISFAQRMKTPREQYERPILPGGLFPRGEAAGRVGEDFIPLTADNPDTKNYLLEVDNNLVIPAGQRVRFLITADDVIHSFWVPDFGYKKDAIPGFINESWTEVPEDQTGIYYGQCAELCGRGHAFMPLAVEVVSQEEFREWVAKKQAEAAEEVADEPFADLDEALAKGEQLYQNHCVACHGGEGGGGVGPSLRGTDLMTNPDRIDENISIVRDGRAAMPAFGAQLSDRELAAVISFQRNAFGNETGDLIQPADIENTEGGQ